MKQCSLNKELILRIQQIVKIIKEENKLQNEIIRDDVFHILEKNSIVIYYPFEDDKDINGFRVKRMLNNKLQEFVYINTANPIEKQIFCAAHELGHIWNIDGKLDKENMDEEEREIIINRFAAELLMPEEIFKSITQERFKMYMNQNKIRVIDLLKIIVYMMNYFFVPYKAIVMRLQEVMGLSEEIVKILLKTEEESLVVIEKLISDGQYTRLNKPNNMKSIDNLAEYLEIAEKKKIFNENKINNIRKEFNIMDDGKVESLNSVINIISGQIKIQ